MTKQMYFKVLVLCLICLGPVFVEATPKNGRIHNGKTLQQRDMCRAMEEFNFFKVYSAFKVGPNVGIIGALGKNGQKDSDNQVGAIWTIPWLQPDPTGKAPSIYYNSTVWQNVSKLYEKMEIQFTFNADYVDGFLIDPDVRRQKLLVVYCPVKTECLHDMGNISLYNVGQRLEHVNAFPDQYRLVDSWQVYNPDDGVDRSQFLTLKLLFLHFPAEIKILDIIIFYRFKNMADFPTHYAIVYTEESFEGKKHYFRQYMRSERREYTDYRGSGDVFYRLDWHFDENVDYCDRLEAGPDAATMLLASIDYMTAPVEAQRLTIRFAEFYGTQHNTMDLVFDYFLDKYTIKKVADGIDNKHLLYCHPHPAMDNAVHDKHIPCNDDYGLDSDYKTSNFGEFGPNFFTYGIVITAIVLAVVLGIGGFFFLRASNQTPEDQKL